MEFSEQLVILFKRFSKAKSYVDNGVVYPHVVEYGQFFTEKANDVLSDVGIGRIELHSARVALHVHDNVRATVGSSHMIDLRVEIASTDVVNPVRTRMQRLIGNFCTEGIYGNKAARKVFKYLRNGRNDVF